MSAKGKHTSGPWKVYHALLRPQFPGKKIIEVQDDHGNAVVKWSGFDDSDRLKKTHLANAHLIAAAPMMLRAMKATQSIIADFADSDEDIKLYDEFCDAIAKAEHRQ
ncbi:MAG: hypothetical protein ABSA68_13475 [Xanthobacteraceae bacterium]|jgi:hypothetical protein